MWQRFSESSRRAILRAQQTAQESHSLEVESEHLLVGLAQAQGSASQILQSAGISPQGCLEAAYRASLASQERQLTTDEIEEFGREFRVAPAFVRALEARLLRKLRGQQENDDLKLSPRLKRVLELAADEARHTRREFDNAHGIGTGHLLLGILRDHGSGAALWLREHGLELEGARQAVVRALQANVAD